MRGARSFPPGIGWIPAAIALGIITILSIAQFVPQFSTKRTIEAVGSTGGAGSAAALRGGQQGDQESGQQGQDGGHSVSLGGRASVAGSGGGGGSANVDCTPGHFNNGGPTAPGVTANAIHIATTEVTTGIGAGFLQDAVSGMRAALSQAGSICGRQIVLDRVQNDAWDRSQGQTIIEDWIGSGSVFALVAEPDSEGLSGAIDSGDIDRAQIPVVGSDGMLKDQYHDPWVWPVAASTVTNMHIIADYGFRKLGVKTFGIVYDKSYRFGPEGAAAFAHEMAVLTGHDVSTSGSCSTGFCGIESQSSGNGGYSSEVTAFNQYCSSPNGSSSPCDLVVMLLEPKPMLDWMNEESSGGVSWYKTLMGGEPLFDYNFGSQCGNSCRGMIVWTGYKPDISPFDSEKAVYTYAQALALACPHCDPHNEFTEGAYLGTQLFIGAVRQVARANVPLTRDNLKRLLNTMTLDSTVSSAAGLTASPLTYTGSRYANVQMAAFQDNASSTNFYGFAYLPSVGFYTDPVPGQDN